MSYPHLKGASILVVEDEALIVMDISMAFDGTGAHVTSTNTLRHASVLVEHDGLTAVMIDNALPDGEGVNLCARLKERSIPFLLYSGMPKPIDGACKDAPFLSKPVPHAVLLEAIDALIRGAKISN